MAWRPDPHSRLTVSPPTSTGKSGQQQRHPRDVAIVLAGLVGAAEDDVLHERRIHAGPIHDGPQGRGREVVGSDGGERPAVAADRRADGLDDPGFSEGAVVVSRHAEDGSGVVASSPPGSPARSAGPTQGTSLSVSMT